MPVKVAINGFGRIGRLAFRQMFEDAAFQIVAINDLTDAESLAYLLEYDTAQGRYRHGEISFNEKEVVVAGKAVPIFAQRDPEQLPWKELGVDVVLECTGFFTDEASASKHVKAGARKVVISAPAKGNLKTIVYNVNHTTLSKDDVIISGASCTTNCLAPLVKVLDDNYGVQLGFMTTVHAYTNDQATLDIPHPKGIHTRRGRAAAANIVPTTTGAAAAVGEVLPHLKGKLDGMALRVPTITGSVVDLVVELKKDASVEQINAMFEKNASETLGFTRVPIVSSDTIGMTFGSLVDAQMTSSIETDGRKLFKILSWYDNEMSYVAQMVRTTKYFGSL
jgi:glyceraldehyde 3-phosphate dehydrogenase